MRAPTRPLSSHSSTPPADDLTPTPTGTPTPTPNRPRPAHRDPEPTPDTTPKLSTGGDPSSTGLSTACGKRYPQGYPQGSGGRAPVAPGARNRAGLALSTLLRWRMRRCGVDVPRMFHALDSWSSRLVCWRCRVDLRAEPSRDRAEPRSSPVESISEPSASPVEIEPRSFDQYLTRAHTMCLQSVCVRDRLVPFERGIAHVPV
jgi:hypothetical protein